MSLADGDRRVVIGIGNDYRRDDGFGPAVVADLAGRRASDPRLSGVDLRVSDGEPARLIGLWTGCALAVVVDVVPGPADHAGDRHELAPAHIGAGAGGSHAVSLGSTVALGRALDRLPGRLVVLAVSGTEFGFGQGLTPPVAAAVPAVAERVCDLVGQHGECPGRRRTAPPALPRSPTTGRNEQSPAGAAPPACGTVG
ncbi:hydrogenase maturation protease [Actinoplanes sp. LDG1-06]|uniref:Hydrogenase maturation protease n=1 Tax=Paractinoplanes ovalisporus TaxID=2810368 RepID=A0ABS2A9A5_9ACTN|nr:hydrogenase maturation protease [Actinoplanes ovalisporus]MBM2616421.1 hydrogenase maturation protease [Actinoplanes ovalisporus]